MIILLVMFSLLWVNAFVQPNPTVVTIHTDDGQFGSGVVVGNEVITAYHVLAGHRHVTVCAKKQCSTEQLYRHDRTSDLASVTWSGTPTRVVVGDAPVDGELVVVRGYPNEIYVKKVAKVITDGWPNKYGLVRITPLNTYVAPGASGGPVFNRSGQLVGIVYASSRSEQVTYVISAGALRSYIP